MPNLYARLRDVKDQGRVRADNDAIEPGLLRHIEAASREVDGRTNRKFYVESGTRYYPARKANTLKPRQMWVDDTATITSVTDDGEVLVSGTDYYGWPRNRGVVEPEPIIRLDRLTGAWPTDLEDPKVAVVGLFGYSNESRATECLLSAGINSSVTTLPVTDTAEIDPGDTVWIDSEQFYIEYPEGGANPSGVLLARRGQNGSTAASHDSGAVLSIRTYPAKVTEAVIIRAIQLHRSAVGGGNAQAGPMDFGYTMGDDFAKFTGLIAEFWRPVVA